MAEFEDKLNAILGNPEAMGQIMALAQSLSGEAKGEEQTPSAEDAGKEEPPQANPSFGGTAGPDLSALLGQMDPAMLRLGAKLLREYRSDDSRNAALLAALRPFLREDRQARLDKALQLARVTRLIRAALGVMGGKEEDRV